MTEPTLNILEAMERLARRLRDTATPADEIVADAVGRCRHIEGILATWRRSLISETPDAAGDEYRIVTGRRAARSYNTAAILAAVSPNPSEALSELQSHDAVRLGWRWTELHGFFTGRGLDLRIVDREVADDGDLDGPMVGQVWSDQTRIEGVSDPAP